MFKRRHPLLAPENNDTPPPGGGDPSGTPPAGGAPAPAPSSASPAPYYESFQNPELKDWLKAYGEAYKTPEAIALKAYNLEKFVGADKAGRGVIAPKPDAPAGEWNAFYKKVGGVPEKADGYKLAEEFGSDPLWSKFREHAHKAGMPPIFFDTVMSFYKDVVVAEANGKQSEFETQMSANAEKDLQELKSKDWAGRDARGALIYDAKIEAGRRAAAAFIEHETDDQVFETMTRIEGAIGTKAMLKLFANIGESMGEHGYIGGEGRIEGAMTPEAARIRIAELKRDKEWGKRFSEGGADEKAEWSLLHRIASQVK